MTKIRFPEQPEIGTVYPPRPYRKVLQWVWNGKMWEFTPETNQRLAKAEAVGATRQ